ncbi:fibroblast growth factor receptor substrate [Pristimantis euphronides]
MQSKGISVLSDTERNTPVGDSSVLSSHRPELNRSELSPDPASKRSSECSTSADGKELKRQHRSHLLLELKVSDGGVSQMSMHSYPDIDDGRGIRPDQACMLKNKMESEEKETLGSIHSGDLNGVLWDAGYDSDDRREASCVRRMGYENVSAVPVCDESRRMLDPLSSSDSQGTSIIPAHVVTDCVFSRPSSPSVFQGQQNQSIMNKDNCPLHATKQWPSRRSSITPQISVPLYFNFELGQSSQETKTLNYIQVEIESGCDSESPQTSDGSVQWGMCQQSEPYAELDLRKTAALSLIQRNQPKKDGTRKTRHNSKYFLA